MVESFIKTMENPRQGWPILDDFQQHRVFFDEKLIAEVESLIQKNNVCLIRGAEGRGKTVLARTVAYNKYIDGWKVYFIDAKELKFDIINKECNAIENFGKNEKTLFIIENAHIPIYDHIKKLMDSVISVIKTASFIFTIRKIISEEKDFFTENAFEEWENNGWYVDLNPELELICGIIENFISIKKIDYSLKNEDLFWIEKEIGIKSANLRRLNWYLEVWNEKSGHLYSIKKIEILEKILRDIINPLDVEVQKMLFVISAVFRFDIYFYGERLNRNILYSLTRKGIIGPSLGYYYKLQHTSDAMYILEAEALRANKDIETFTTTLLKEYLQTNPENYFELIKALIINKENKILSNIFNDPEIYKTISNMIEQDNIGAIGAVLSYVEHICGKEKGLELWLQCKKSSGNTLEKQKINLKGKITEASLDEIVSLLTILKKIDTNEYVWLSNEVLEKKTIIAKAKDDLLPLSFFLKMITILPEQLLSSVLSELNPNDIVNLIKKTKSENAQKIMWILRFCSKANKNYTKLFLLSIKEDRLIEKLKNSDFGVVKRFLSYTRNVNKQLYDEFVTELSPYWLQILLSSGLNSITQQLGELCFYEGRWIFGYPADSEKLIVKNLATSDLSEPIKELYNKPDSKPFKTLGKLLDFSHQIAFENDKNSLEKVTMQIVNNINLKKQEMYTMEELSLLMANVKMCNEMAWKQLCHTILLDLDLENYIGSNLDKGLAVLIWHIHQYDNKIGQELTVNILSIDINILIERLETNAVNMLIWNLLQINYLKTKSWLYGLNHNTLLSKVLSSSNYDAFTLLWNLYHIDTDKVKNVAQSFANNILPNITTLAASDLPLLGFFSFCNIQFNLYKKIPSSFEIAEEMIMKLSLTRIAFCLFYLNKKNYNIASEFSIEFSRQLFEKNIEFPIEATIANIPFEEKRQFLLKIFKDFPILDFPDSIFIEMIRQTKIYSSETKKNKVAFGKLRDFFMGNDLTGFAIFKSINDSNKWLNKAIEYGIYHIDQVPHYRNPSVKVNLLSLNTENELVSSFLKKNF